MGNCFFGGMGDQGGEGLIKVKTSNGGVMELYSPVTAGCIINEFPGHAIFPSHDLFWRPLSLQEELLPRQSYYLLPIDHSSKVVGDQLVKEGHVRSKSIPTSLMDASYRMSFDCQGMLKRSYTEVFSRYQKNGFWKVKLVISPEQLLDILSQEGSTQELIENVRAVAKCGNGISTTSATATAAAAAGSASSVGFSDQWSFSSTSRNASNSKDVIVDLI